MTDAERELLAIQGLGWHLEPVGCYYDGEHYVMGANSWLPDLDLNQAAQVAIRIADQNHGLCSWEYVPYQDEHRATCCGARVQLVGGSSGAALALAHACLKALEAQP